MLEARIAKLEERLASARVIEKREISKDVVSVGSKVRLRDVDASRPSSTASSARPRRIRPS